MFCVNMIQLLIKPRLFFSFYLCLISIFHTGHEKPESPQLLFFFFGFGGIREVSIVMSYESISIKIRCH